jgi:hypothetical protein
MSSLQSIQAKSFVVLVKPPTRDAVSMMTSRYFCHLKYIPPPGAQFLGLGQILF